MLFRLRSRSEDISLKVGILEFLVVTVQYQPGLLEHFLDLRLADGENSDKVWPSVSCTYKRFCTCFLILQTLPISDGSRTVERG